MRLGCDNVIECIFEEVQFKTLFCTVDVNRFAFSLSNHFRSSTIMAPPPRPIKDDEPLPRQIAIQNGRHITVYELFCVSCIDIGNDITPLFALDLIVWNGEVVPLTPLQQFIEIPRQIPQMEYMVMEPLFSKGGEIPIMRCVQFARATHSLH
eukprot:148347_1